MSKTRKKKGKRKSAYGSHNISGIGQHTRQGSRLRPPLASLNTTPSNWADEHMPEMLWAVLLTGVLERSHYLSLFRQVAIVAREWASPQTDTTPTSPDIVDPGEHLDMTRLAQVQPSEFAAFVSPLLRHPLGPAALRPLLLVKDLPGLDRWTNAIPATPDKHDFRTLALAVGGVLDHQSEQSTDIRWLKLIFTIISGRLFFPEGMEEEVEELRLFPNKGDMRAVRPRIRSCEMMIRRRSPRPWIGHFWEQMLVETQCIDVSQTEGAHITPSLLSAESVQRARASVIDRFYRHTSARRVDPRLDGSFGIALYVLSLVEELGAHCLQSRITARLILRTVVEALITLRYLRHQDRDELWQSYRVYGAGQAKLTFLKAQEFAGDLPSFMDESALYSIANEDTWQEFLDIDVGHWSSSNLRKLALASGSKEIYDRFYDWTSTVAHAHWGAVRDTNFATCHNPLHRLHRIPRMQFRQLPSVDGDLVELVNKVLTEIDILYPEADLLPGIYLELAES